jgi:hypothetical protein
MKVMEIFTATLILQKHLNQQNDKRNLPKVNEEKLKEAVNLLTDLLFNVLDNRSKISKYLLNMNPENHITNIVVDPDFETL